MSISKLSRGTVLAAAVLVGCAAAGFFVAQSWLGGGQRPATGADYQATVLNNPRPLPAVELTTKTGDAWTPDRDGEWQLMFFGFTHCPDVCPLTLTVMKQLKQRLADGSSGINLDVVFVSVDPARDDADTIRQYVEYFDPRFQGLTGELEQIRRLTDALYLPFSHTPDDSAVGYRVDHSGALVLVNPRGSAVAYMTPPHDVAGLATQIRRLVRRRS